MMLLRSYCLIVLDIIRRGNHFAFLVGLCRFLIVGCW